MISRAWILLPLLAVLPLGAQAAEIPHRKPGLWTLTMKFGDGKLPPRETKLCVDAATDAAFLRYNEGATQCSKHDVTVSGNQTIIDSVCTINDHTSTGHAVMTWAGDTAYHLDSTTRWSPPLYGKTESHTAQDGKWTGACPASMKPGDMTMPGGMTVNVLTMGQQLPPKPPAH